MMDIKAPNPIPPAKRHVPMWIALAIITVAAMSVAVWAWDRAGFFEERSSHCMTGELCAPGDKNVSSELKAYRNEEYGFELKYPSEYNLRTSPIDCGPNAECDETWVEGYIPFGRPTGDIGVKAVISMQDPKTAYPNTDLDQAFFAVKITTESEKNCGSLDYFEDRGQDEINGIVFKKRSTGSGAAGHQAEQNKYARFENGKCFVLIETIYTSGFGAVYGLNQVDKEEVFSKLDEITSSFKFFTPEISERSDGWKTYRNRTLGYEISYPSKWQLILGDSGYLELSSFEQLGGFKGIPHNELYLVGDIFRREVTLQQLINEDEGVDFRTEKVEDLLINDKPAKIVRRSEPDLHQTKVRINFVKVYYVSNGKGFVFSIEPAFTERMEEAKQILSSFRFID